MVDFGATSSRLGKTKADLSSNPYSNLVQAGKTRKQMEQGKRIGRRSKRETELTFHSNGVSHSNSNSDEATGALDGVVRSTDPDSGYALNSGSDSIPPP